MYNIMSNPIEALLQINVLFNNEQNIHSLPSFFSPPSSLYRLPCCCLYLKIAQRKCSRLWKVASSLLSCQATVEKRSMSVSSENVGEKRNVCISLREYITSKWRDRNGGQSLYKEDNVSVC